jgi:hypothetical protein
MKEPSLEHRQLISQMRRRVLFKSCYHFDEHCNDAARAHSLSSKKVLSQLAKQGKLLTIDVRKGIPGTGLVMTEKGQKSSSTFTGMCKFHDAIFHPIDNADYEPGNLMQEFLFAYRIAAREKYTKETQLRATELSLGLVDGTAKPINGFDPSHLQDDPFYQATMEVFHTATRGSLDTMADAQSYLNKNFDRGNYHRVSTAHLIFDRAGFAVASGFLPEVDLSGNVLNDLRSEKFTRARPLYVTIFPQGNKTYVLLSYLTKNKEIIGPLVKDIATRPLDEQQIIISNIVAINCENIFFNKDYWLKLSEPTRSTFLTLFEKTVDMGDFAEAPEPDLVQESTLNLFKDMS